MEAEGNLMSKPIRLRDVNRALAALTLRVAALEERIAGMDRALWPKMPPVIGQPSWPTPEEWAAPTKARVVSRKE
ncbi:hypothetical protein LCGC14_2106970 [marine sediment metagenome]|uniref:Uncharacterized protein n=1 Tax=marine sediment metagenome TaxID=412755 RepID=A0A0F9E8F0_9ZZZZ